MNDTQVLCWIIENVVEMRRTKCSDGKERWGVTILLQDSTEWTVVSPSLINSIRSAMRYHASAAA